MVLEVPSPTPASIPGGGADRNRARGRLDKLPYGVNVFPHSVTLGGSRAWAQGWHREGTGGGRLQKRRSKYFGSTMEGAEPLLLSQHNAGVGAGLGAVARTVQ